MATRIEIAKNKLENLRKELHEASEKAFAHMRLTNGQPMNDKGGAGRTFMKKQYALEDKAIELTRKIEDQEKYIEKLEDRAEQIEKGLSANGGLKIQASNLAVWEQRVSDYEFAKKYNKDNGLKFNTPVEVGSKTIYYNSAKLKKAREAVEKILKMADMNSTDLKDNFKNLIDENKINQWKAKPHIYFVKGLRKVALEADGKGNLIVSKKYYPKTDEEKEIVRNLIG